MLSRVLITCIVVLIAIATYFVWESLQREDGTLSAIVRGAQIRSENQDRMRQWERELQTTDVGRKSVLLTGGSRGLGRGIAAHLLGAGAHMILPLRDMPKNQSAFRNELLAEARDLGYHVAPESINDLVLLPMDLSDFNSIKQFVLALKELHLLVNVLINNAGLVSLDSNTTAQGFQMTMGVNFFGTAHLTLLLDEQGLLAKDVVVVNVGSEEHRGAPPLPSDLFNLSGDSLASKFAAYGQSKLALAGWSYELARKWPAPRVVRCVCPGPVVSDIGRAAPWPLSSIVSWSMKSFFQPATEAALPVLWLALSPAAQKVSEVNWHMSRPLRAGQNASQPAFGEWVWNEMVRARTKTS